MRKRTALAALLAAALIGTACSGDVLPGGGDGFDAAPVDLQQTDNSTPPSDVAEMVEDVLPSVVNVRVTSVGPDLAQRQGEGSGVVIDRNGIILTNAHVVQGAVEVTIVTSDGKRQLEGRVIGAAPERDLAVVKVDARLDPITIGRSSPPNLRLGDQVVALGFPLHLGGPTVTQGIVSGLRRNIDVQDSSLGGVRRLEGMLQTDAAINPGNSGGALVNAAGQLVGINSAGASTAENVGFAIAIDDALPVVEQILEEPPSERAWLGVYVAELNPLIASQLGLPSGTRGALIDSTIPGGPAAAAGLETGEVIVAVGDHEVASSSDLTSALEGFAPGDEVSVDVVGPNGSRSVDVVLERRPATF
ncbi:MAG TPA: trypsin-like peptidase domain-containing protein [Actinomycetota bacterium]|nr:trypsin-like peptidase domain-containing protein [Actinomycetota bacterium]